MYTYTAMCNYLMIIISHVGAMVLCTSTVHKRICRVDGWLHGDHDLTMIRILPSGGRDAVRGHVS